MAKDSSGFERRTNLPAQRTTQKQRKQSSPRPNYFHYFAGAATSGVATLGASKLTVGGWEISFSFSTATHQGNARWIIIEGAFQTDKLSKFPEKLAKDADKKAFLLLENLHKRRFKQRQNYQRQQATTKAS